MAGEYLFLKSPMNHNSMLKCLFVFLSAITGESYPSGYHEHDLVIRKYGISQVMLRDFLYF